MQQKLAEKEKAQKEETLRMLAQRAREERTGVPSSSSRPAAESRPTAERTAAMQSSLGAYGSESESDASEDEDDEEAAKIRDRMREERGERENGRCV